VPDNVVTRVAPVAVGARFVSIPVRITVDAAGAVKNIHVISASAAQRRNIEEALQQWKFKPYELNGRAVEIETGLSFRFADAGN
jgi:periplasmic protein TonB